MSPSLATATSALVGHGAGKRQAIGSGVRVAADNTVDSGSLGDNPDIAANICASLQSHRLAGHW